MQPPIILTIIGLTFSVALATSVVSYVAADLKRGQPKEREPLIHSSIGAAIIAVVAFALLWS